MSSEVERPIGAWRFLDFARNDNSVEPSNQMIALRDSLGSDFVERVRSIFSETGLLAKAKNFEYRPQQQGMAVAVARALEEERHLVIEAGTGVGKSIAYLAPAVLLAVE